jgi:hypothetical protein
MAIVGPKNAAIPSSKRPWAQEGVAQYKHEAPASGSPVNTEHRTLDL